MYRAFAAPAAQSASSATASRGRSGLRGGAVIDTGEEIEHRRVEVVGAVLVGAVTPAGDHHPLAIRDAFLQPQRALREVAVALADDEQRRAAQLVGAVERR